MGRQVPKNVRQIGNVSDSPKIYVEDYVDTFFIQLCEKAGEGPVGAFLVGDIQKTDEEEYVYIYGAIQMHDLKLSGTDYLIDDDTWKKAYEDCKQYFEDGEMLGWFVAHQGVPLLPDNNTVKLHKKSFPKKNSVFIMKDPAEKEEVYYVHKFNDLMEIGGHYTYYEKNPCMQNYMISTRKKNGVSPSETVEDRAAKDFRSLAKNKGGHQQKRTSRLMYAASICLILVVVVMGVTTINNVDKMKSVQSTLSNIEDTKSTDSPNAAAQETNGNVTAVTGDAAKTAAKAAQADAEDQTASEDQAAQAAGEDQTAQAAAEDQTAQAANEDQTAQTDPADVTAESDEGIYVVEKGDTLALISRKAYGDLTHVDAICKMNGLSDGNLIYIGQKLLLP